MASGSSASGVRQLGMTTTLSFEDRVSPVSAVASFGSMTISPAIAFGLPTSSEPIATWI